VVEERAWGGRLSPLRMGLAFLVAAASDLISYWAVLVPLVQWGVDLVTALSLFVILGWRWALLPGLVVEAIPVLAVFPFWVLVVAAVGIWGRVRRPVIDVRERL
jgi:hypothetical protein